jgi:hypothetical protein
VKGKEGKGREEEVKLPPTRRGKVGREEGKCFFAFSHPSPLHLLSLVGRWVPRGSHAGSKSLRGEMGEKMHYSISRGRISSSRGSSIGWDFA